jgi:hypothetical protein
VSKCIFKTLLANFTCQADSLRFTSRTTLLREESFWISLGAERTLLPGKLNYLAIA